MNRILLFITILGIVVLFIIQSVVFKVSTVSYEKKNADCFDNKAQSLFNLEGKSILFLDITKTKDDLKKKYLCIEDITLTKKYPKSVLVIIQGQTPSLDFLPTFGDGSLDALATLSGTLKKQYYITSNKGLIFKTMESSPSGIPLIFYSGSRALKVGDNLGSLASNTKAIITRLQELSVPMFELKLQENYLEVQSDNPKLIIFDTQGDFSRELASLQLILQAGKMNSGQLPMERVDLRFEKPVINYSPKR